jgi:hypothetical protein
MFLPSPDQVWPIFMGTWIVLGVGGLLFFRTTAVTAALKERIWPVFIIGTGILFVLFCWLMDGNNTPLFFLIPGVAIISALNLRRVRFCHSCNSMQYRNSFFSPQQFCQRCGHDLERPDGDLRGSENT